MSLGEKLSFLHCLPCVEKPNYDECHSLIGGIYGLFYQILNLLFILIVIFIFSKVIKKNFSFEKFLEMFL